MDHALIGGRSATRTTYSGSAKPDPRIWRILQLTGTPAAVPGDSLLLTFHSPERRRTGALRSVHWDSSLTQYAPHDKHHNLLHQSDEFFMLISQGGIMDQLNSCFCILLS
ncbi:unnamed protein product [Pleuronectes platessa]|uniref:Uncharacterized protein n=1 Tax=Pleuronectes platessa TaxID=8262 RepID=A0A9N7Z156_PLEPL|nr:unnamed protein product [Pleuronectes platessa]